MSSSPNGPAVLYEYITNTNEKRPTFFRARARLVFSVRLSVLAEVKGPQVRSRVHDSWIQKQLYPTRLFLAPWRFPALRRYTSCTERSARRYVSADLPPR